MRQSGHRRPHLGKPATGSVRARTFQEQSCLPLRALNPVALRTNLKSMKLVLFLLAAATAFAQVPAHSVLGTVTLDIADISLSVPYGSAESRAAISACSATPVAFL